MDQRIRLVERFVEARAAVKTQPSEMIRLCNQLLDQPDIEQAVRVGDVFALLIEYFHAQGNAGAFQQAYNLIERMRDRNIIITPYLDQAIIDRVYDAMGIAQPQRPGAAAAHQQHQQQQHDDDEVGDEIPEEDL